MKLNVSSAASDATDHPAFNEFAKTCVVVLIDGRSVIAFPIPAPIPAKQLIEPVVRAA